MPITYEWLCDMMRCRTRVAIAKDDKVYRGLINGILPESGSGRDWLITLSDNGEKTTVYIRTA